MEIASNGTAGGKPASKPNGKRRHIPIGLGDAEPANSGELLLLREMTHRINNELASTINVAACAALRSSSREVKVALGEVIEQLHDQARVYCALQMPAADQPVDAAAYLRELCQSISRARLRHRGIELLLIENPLQLASAQCWRLGLIVSELITNASRHAFASGGGTIRIELKRCGSRAECHVSDNGAGYDNAGRDVGPNIREGQRQGQGFAIIRDLACGLNGTFEQQFAACGAVAVVSFPILDV